MHFIYDAGRESYFTQDSDYLINTTKIGLHAIPTETLRYVLDVVEVVKESQKLPSDSIFLRYLPSKIQAIKRVRDDTGVSLKTAKEFVDFVWLIKGL